jgi:tRNA A-37 threonylcarbamoyl transferase component Bud32
VALTAEYTRRLRAPPTCGATHMKAEDNHAQSIFGEAVQIADVAERNRFLRQACAGDPQVLGEVQSLLEAHQRCAGFLQTIAGLPDRETPTGSLPRRFGEYELLAEMERGGMGIVYKARQRDPSRIVAVKMIRGGGLAGRVEVRRFRSEVAAAASLDHPNIVGVHEVGNHKGQLYYTMPFVEGVSLSTLVEQRRWHSPDGREAARVVAIAARAMQHAHEHGILHRDIKPGNILLDANGEPHILDFGLAKHFRIDNTLTTTGDVLGSPSYMAPEQAAGHANEATPSADIYGLGAVLYYLLTGRPPFAADSPLDVIRLVLEGEAALPRSVNSKIGADLERICLRCLEKNPEKRYESAGRLADDLERYLQGEAIPFPASTLRERLWVWTRKQPGLVLRGSGLVASAFVSEISYQIRGGSDPLQHYRIIAVIGLWLVGSLLCQKASARPAWAERARFAWATLDALSVTAILLLDEAVESGLIALYPALVALSGLWLRVPLVLLTTVLSELGYLLLVVTAVLSGDVRLDQPLHWPVIVMVVLALEGLEVAYFVDRMRTFNRLCEARTSFA